MNNAARGQVRLGTITHQSLGQEPLKDTSCLNGKQKEGAVAGERLRGSQPTAPNPPFTLLQWSQGLAASGASLKYISLFRACLNETSGLKNHTVCGSINTSSPTMATQQVSVTKHCFFPRSLSLSLAPLPSSSLLKSHVLFIPITPTFTQIHAHLCSFNQNLSKDKHPNYHALLEYLYSCRISFFFPPSSQIFSNWLSWIINLPKMDICSYATL